MDSHQIMVISLISLVLFILPSFGAYLLFPKAGEPGWKAVVPVLNTYVMLRIARRPLIWFFLQFIPVVGWFITLGLLIEFIKTFGRFKFWEHALIVLTGGLYFIVIGM